MRSTEGSRSGTRRKIPGKLNQLRFVVDNRQQSVVLCHGINAQRVEMESKQLSSLSDDDWLSIKSRLPINNRPTCPLTRVCERDEESFVNKFVNLNGRGKQSGYLQSICLRIWCFRDDTACWWHKQMNVLIDGCALSQNPARCIHLTSGIVIRMTKCLKWFLDTTLCSRKCWNCHATHARVCTFRFDAHNLASWHICDHN